MTKEVNEGLKHIAKGKGFDAQQRLRMYYNALRRKDIKLGRNKLVTITRCVEAVRKDYPSAKPSYDLNYFR